MLIFSLPRHSYPHCELYWGHGHTDLFSDPCQVLSESKWGQVGLLATGDLIGCADIFKKLFSQQLPPQHKNFHGMSEGNLWQPFWDGIHHAM